VNAPVPNGPVAREWGIVGWPRHEALDFLRQARDEIAANGGADALPFTEAEIRALSRLIGRLDS